MNYRISSGTRQAAKRLGVSIKVSTNKKKKLDVFKNGEKVASVGARGYMDYWSYLRRDGLQEARKRRRLYKARHEKHRHKKNTNSYWADQLLW